MLRSFSELHDCAIGATDGLIGHVKDLYIDDQHWVVRYLVVDTGSWLSSRKVLISPMAISEPDWTGRSLPVSLTKEKVRNSPPVDTDKPVTRQHEVEFSGYYGYPSYWGGVGFWGRGMYPNTTLPGEGGFGSPNAILEEAQADRTSTAAPRDADPHLRSCKAITGYHIHATDGDIGHVSGMLIDDATWAVRYLIVDTSNWWLGHKMLIAPQWIEALSWADGTVSVKMTRQAVKDAPAFEPTRNLTRADEVLLHEHHGRSGYWPADQAPAAPASRR